MGRFISVDPLMASARAATPQSFNRYTYGLNNSHMPLPRKIMLAKRS